MTYTFLRDTIYSNYLPYLAGDDGVIRGPGGDGRLAADVTPGDARRQFLTATFTWEPSGACLAPG
jgi:NAD(P)H dehydrogenase (quinone)